MDWDEDLDLDADDMSEEEVKRIMENMAANKQETGNQEDADVDVSYFNSYSVSIVIQAYSFFHA